VCLLPYRCCAKSKIATPTVLPTTTTATPAATTYATTANDTLTDTYNYDNNNGNTTTTSAPMRVSSSIPDAATSDNMSNAAGPTTATSTSTLPAANSSNKHPAFTAADNDLCAPSDANNNNDLSSSMFDTDCYSDYSGDAAVYLHATAVNGTTCISASTKELNCGYNSNVSAGLVGGLQ
jgi:hypothetical protein